MTSLKTLRHSGIVLIAFGLGAVIELGRDVVIARWFGATAHTDAFYVALSLPYIVTSTLLATASVAFTPHFTRALAQAGKAGLWRAVNQIASLVFLAASSLGFLLFAGAGALVTILAPGLEATSAELATAMLRVLSITVILAGLAMLAIAALNSLEYFFWPALLRFIRNLIVIGVVIALARRLDVFSLAGGFSLAALIEFLSLFVQLRREGYKFQFSLDLQAPDIQPALRDASLPLAGSLIRQSSRLVERALTSLLLPGSITLLDFSFRWILALVSILGASSVTGSLPTLSQYATANDNKGLLDVLRLQFRAVCFLVLPLTVALVVFGRSLMIAIYVGGAFTIEMADRTALLLALYALGLPFFVWAQVLSSAFYAVRRPMVVFIHVSLMTAVNIVLIVVLVFWLGLIGIPLAFTLTNVVSFARQTVLVYLNIGPFFERRIVVFVGKVGLASATMGLFTWFVNNLLGVSQALDSVLQLATLIAASGAVFLLVSFLLRIDGLKTIITRVRLAVAR